MQNEITELRNQVRTLKRIVYGFGCLLVAGVVVGTTSLQTVPDVIQAKRFEVVNDEGNVLALLSSTKFGTGALHIMNKEWKQVAFLGAAKKGGIGLFISRMDGKKVAILGANPVEDENPGGLFLYNLNGTKVAVVGVNSEGNGVLDTLNEKGEITFHSP